MLLMLVIVEFIAFVWSTICLIAFEYLSARIVIHGAHYEMFSSKWWAFHWCDMFRSRYHMLWPHFFADSPIFTWFMRSLLGARVGKNVVISEPHLNEPQLQSIGNDSVISWNSWLQPHTYNGHTLILGSINVGNSCFVDSHAVLLPESEMDEGSSLLPVSLLMKGDHVQAQTRFEGVPARASPRAS